MVYKIILKPEAEKELLEALDWYDTKKEGLGVLLYNEISEVLNHIQNNPKHFQKVYRKIRISFTTQFRYGVHYTIEKNTIYIHAILHTSMEPRQ